MLSLKIPAVDAGRKMTPFAPRFSRRRSNLLKALNVRIWNV